MPDTEDEDDDEDNPLGIPDEDVLRESAGLPSECKFDHDRMRNERKLIYGEPDAYNPSCWDDLVSNQDKAQISALQEEIDFDFLSRRLPYEACPCLVPGDNSAYFSYCMQLAERAIKEKFRLKVAPSRVSAQHQARRSPADLEKFCLVDDHKKCAFHVQYLKALGGQGSH